MNEPPRTRTIPLLTEPTIPCFGPTSPPVSAPSIATMIFRKQTGRQPRITLHRPWHTVVKPSSDNARFCGPGPTQPPRHDFHLPILAPPSPAPTHKPPPRTCDSVNLHDVERFVTRNAEGDGARGVGAGPRELRLLVEAMA